ncbi:MAG: type IV secretory system conjugative DNA transfer family protein, partial [Porcincola intestinalis]|nr:type IV secretory system conjugative DNA transfer family protein [Porcincola intestinalis]
MNGSKWRKKLILWLPYIIVGLICTNFGEAWRLAEGVNASEKLQDVFQSGTLQTAF